VTVPVSVLLDWAWTTPTTMISRRLLTRIWQKVSRMLYPNANHGWESFDAVRRQVDQENCFADDFGAVQRSTWQ
jgi:hypothetical protein